MGMAMCGNYGNKRRTKGILSHGSLESLGFTLIERHQLIFGRIGTARVCIGTVGGGGFELTQECSVSTVPWGWGSIPMNRSVLFRNRSSGTMLKRYRLVVTK